uniref:Uncharacterized protein n=1 Tax=Anguilla anguilla TaxID=7936 RepID=A0A0E9V7L2_ANGAN
MPDGRHNHNTISRRNNQYSWSVNSSVWLLLIN